jgi:hypothetical protein
MKLFQHGADKHPFCNIKLFQHGCVFAPYSIDAGDVSIGGNVSHFVI